MPDRKRAAGQVAHGSGGERDVSKHGWSCPGSRWTMALAPRGAHCRVCVGVCWVGIKVGRGHDGGLAIISSEV
ncbi:Uncharacterized protein DAT39_016931 [Clarias magur]|uniref:Uncharacterized protein n=1 Tax=Clarias magur TaxID=1594786 RepID=A0A8J4TM73_CLAMG|nr:Uncharacterized protein DAT39_016931 [Clarias magur]